MSALDWASSASSSASATFSTVSSTSSYDVFLNFRGEDTRNNFTGFLNLVLRDRGIDVFIDSKKLWAGEAIGPALHRAIERSKISITVFSEGYAHSKWCLLELAQIVQCHISKGQIVLPIFFHIKPSDVRYQTGSFEEAFQKHEKNFDPRIVESWKEALRVAGNLKGEVIDKNKDQAEVVELVVKRALDELVNSTHLAGCKFPIGIDSHVEDLISMLNIDSNNVQFVGICGFGGIGKTTIAKATYNRILLSFNRHSFISNVREQAMQCMGLVSLQKRLLKDIFQTDFDIGDYHRGKKLIERKLCNENVLLVLDDVDSMEQIDALAGELNWFGQRSRVIITTRDEYILSVAKVGKDNIYWLEELDHEESLQLFSLHAFSRDQPPQDYTQLSHDVVRCSGGLPLTLEVLGSYLSQISNKKMWKSTLQKLNAGTASTSSLASLRTQMEDTGPLKDNPFGCNSLLDGNTTERENTMHAEKEHMTNGNSIPLLSKSMGTYLNQNESTVIVSAGKRFPIKSKIKAALSKIRGEHLNRSESTTIDRVGIRFSVAEIRAATRNFDASLVIGRGGFGIVYKGVIDGTQAAIKRSRPQSQQGLVEFETEIEVLSKLRHRHVVSMIGFCEEKNEKILVIEYMAKGSLRNHLFGTSFPPLTWKQRLEICVGVARGLHYLHTWAEIGIIHRDVKTSNILLDENFVAKIADFGLSRTCSALGHSPVNTHVMGTCGYLAPEYAVWGKLTIKSDVYSFGVVLFEVICARPALNAALRDDQMSLPEWALRCQRHRIFETIVDRRLEGNYCPESLKKFGETAEKCLANEGKKRPTMGEVLWDLEYILQLHEAWLRGRAGKKSSTLVAKNVELGEIKKSLNPIGQEEESCLKLRTEDDKEAMAWRTSGLDGTVGFDEFSDLIDPQGR